MPKPDVPPEQAISAPEGVPEATSKTAFDLWLRRGLHELFDAVANEPIPRRLLQLLGRDGQAKPD